MSTFHQNSKQNPSGYEPVDKDDGYIDDEVYEQPYSDETYEQPYAVQYQTRLATNQRGQAGQSRSPDQRLGSFVDSFESIN